MSKDKRISALDWPEERYANFNLYCEVLNIILNFIRIHKSNLSSGETMNQLVMLRDATLADKKELSNIIRESFQDVAGRFGLTFDNCPKHPSNCTIQWIESDQIRGVKYFILTHHTEPIGCVGLEKANSTLCYLERLAVLPKMRHKGYGRMLVQQALAYAKALGALKVSIGIIAAQDELKSWYAGIGFVHVGTKTYGHLPFDVAIMEIDL